MPRRSLRSVIDNLSTEDLKDYLEQVLKKNPELKKEFMDTFKEKSDEDVLSAALHDLNVALSTIDSEEYERVTVEYWDESSDPVWDLMNNAREVIKTTCNTLLQQKNYKLMQDFLTEAARQVNDFYLGSIVVTDVDCDFGDDTWRVIDELSDTIREFAARDELPAKVRTSLKKTLDAIFADDSEDSEE